jgi:hypothetical protein
MMYIRALGNGVAYQRMTLYEFADEDHEIVGNVLDDACMVGTHTSIWAIEGPYQGPYDDAIEALSAGIATDDELPHLPCPFKAFDGPSFKLTPAEEPPLFCNL